MGRKMIHNLFFILAFSLALSKSIDWGAYQSTIVAGTVVAASYIERIDKATVLATFVFAILLRLLSLA